MILQPVDKNTLSTFEKNLIQQSLEQDQILAFPTDTVYGLGVNGFSKSAVQALFDTKGRDTKKPLILFIPSTQQLHHYAKIPNESILTYLNEFWPGSLTVVLPFLRSSKLYYTKNSCDTIAIRMPGYPLLLDLLGFLPFPLVTTSANISGEAPIQSASEIEYVFNIEHTKIPFIIDGGLIMGNPSRIIQYQSDKWVTIRP